MRVRSFVIRFGALVAALAGVPSVALAQTAPDPPAVISPLRSEPDVNGVNLATGKKDMDMPVVLSVPADPRLRFDKIQNAAPYITGTATSAGDSFIWSYSVHIGASTSESFKCPEGDCVSTTGSGSRLPGPSFYQRAQGGEFYTFNLVHLDEMNGTHHDIQRYASKVTYPDGEVITHTYDLGYVTGLNRTFYRPTRLTSSTGYYITIAYLYTGTDASVMNWAVPAEAAIYAPDNTLIRHVTYGSNYTTITDFGAGDPVGRIYQAAGVSNALGLRVEAVGATLQLPTEESNSLTISAVPSYALIGSVSRDGVAWNYSYANIAVNPKGAFGDYNYSNVTVSGPNGYSMSYAMGQGGIADGYNNYIASQTNALGSTTSFAYDSSRGWRLTGLTLPEGNNVTIGYDECANIVTKTTAAKPGSGLADIVETATYPSTGFPENPCPDVSYYRPTSYTDALGRVTNFTYNSLGQLTQQVDPGDNAGVRRETDITYTVSAGGHSRKTLVRVCGATTTCSGNAESHTEYTYFGETNLPATVTVKDEATGATRTTTYSYDAAGRPLSIDGPLSGADDAVYSRYDVYGRKTWEIGAADANGVRQVKRYTYRDSDDKVTKAESGTIPDPNSTNLTLIEQSDITYDSRRYAIREATSSGGTNYRVTDKSFLDRGLADCTTVRMNLAALPAATAPGACSLGTTGSQGPDRIAKNTYDNAGQLLKVQKAYQVTTANGFPATLQQDYVTYTYTNNGKQQYVTDANGNKAQFKYDGYDRLQCWIFPSKTSVGQVSGDCVTTGDYEKYIYDAAGNRTSLRKRDGSTLTYTFDNLNRVITKVVPSRADLTAAQVRDVYTSYDLIGRPLTVKFDSITGADGIANSYDGFGNLAASAISMAGFNRTLSSQYDDGGRRTRLTHSDGAYFDLTYDARGQMDKAWWWTAATGTVQFMDIDYDGSGRRSTINRASSWTDYAYDAISRPTSFTQRFAGGTGNLVETLGLNPASQITSQSRDNDGYAYSGLVGVNRNYAVNGLNQYTAAGPASFTYDANGNLITDGTSTYIYDIENRLVKATAGGVTTDLTYDPLGRLWQIVKGSANTRFLYDGDELAAEYDGSGAMVRRFMFAGLDEPILEDAGGLLNCSGTKFLHTDHLGSVIALADCWGGRTNVNTYDEYGIPGASNTGRFQYTGQAWLSELGMYYYKARLYSPTLGRFLQADPIGYADQINLYAYVGDDPVNASDPTGTITWQEASNLLNGTLEVAAGSLLLVAGDAAAGAVEVGSGGLATPVAVPVAAAATVTGAALIGDGARRIGSVLQNRAAPPGNGGTTTRPHGSPEHDSAVNREVQKMKDQGYRDVRKNQAQVDARGNKVGSNRPDVQGTNPRTGQREHVEVDRDPNRGAQHQRDIMKNDSSAVCTLKRCPQ